MSAKYRVSLVNPDNGFLFVDDRLCPREEIYALLTMYTALTGVGKEEFLARLYSDGVAEHIHGSGHDHQFLDITALEER